MAIVRHDALPVHRLPGIVHRTVAGHAQNVAGMEVWHQVLAPGAETPVHRHQGDEVIVVLSGSGRVTLAGETQEFSAGSTLIVPSDVVHQIVNTGSQDMTLIAALAAAPVRVRTADGEPLPVPWQAPGA